MTKIIISNLQIPDKHANTQYFLIPIDSNPKNFQCDHFEIKILNTALFLNTGKMTTRINNAF